MIHKKDCLKFLAKQPDDAYAMTFGSPPYPLKGARYENGAKMTVPEWVAWMAEVVTECVRVSRGFVWFVVNNPIRRGEYVPAIEMLQVMLHDEGQVLLERPDIWHKNATPSRNGAYFSNDYEQVICCKSIRNPDFHWESIATPPKFRNGGAFRQRSNNGGHRTNGSTYPKGKLARPRDVFRVTVGGGHMGFDMEDSRIACEGKAPFPLGVAERFVLVGSRHGEVVFDPFAGSATTGVACIKHGREFVGTEIDSEEIKIGRKRMRRAASELPLPEPEPSGASDG